MAISTTTAQISQGDLVINTNGLPDPALSGNPLGSRRFPGNPPIVIEGYDLEYRFTYRAGQSQDLPSPQALTLEVLGIALNGVAIAGPASPPGPLPGTTTNPPTGFTYNRVFNEDRFGVDICGGYCCHLTLEDDDTEFEQYRYHSGSFLVNCWGSKVIASNTYFQSSNYQGDYFRHPDGHSKIVGYCFDGYPIYGPFGYRTPSDPRSEPIKMRSSYRPFPSPRIGRESNYSQIPPGTYIQDFEYVENLGTLDQYNGRYTKTPDYPTGTYAYFLALDKQNRPVYPYIFGKETRKTRDCSCVGTDDHDHEHDDHDHEHDD